MLTTDNLRKFGANVSEGIARCLDDEEFYLDLVKSAVPDAKIDELEQCIAAKDFDRAFEIAHALKGMYGNISLTPIYEPINQITELLRSRTDTDYSSLLAEAKAQKARLNELADSPRL